MAGQSWTKHNTGKKIMFGGLRIAVSSLIALEVAVLSRMTRLYTTSASFSDKVPPSYFYSGGPLFRTVSGNLKQLDLPGGSWTDGKLAVSWVAWNETPSPSSMWSVLFKGNNYSLDNPEDYGARHLLQCSVFKDQSNTYGYIIMGVFAGVGNGQPPLDIKLFGLNPGGASLLPQIRSIPHYDASRTITKVTKDGKGFFSYKRASDELNQGISYLNYTELSSDLLSVQTVNVATYTSPSAGSGPVSIGPDGEKNLSNGTAGSSFGGVYTFDNSVVFNEISTSFISQQVVGTVSTYASYTVYQGANPTTPVPAEYKVVNHALSYNRTGVSKLVKLTPSRDGLGNIVSWSREELHTFGSFSHSLSGAVSSPTWSSDGVTPSNDTYTNPGPWHAGNPPIPFYPPASPTPTDLVVTGSGSGPILWDTLFIGSEGFSASLGYQQKYDITATVQSSFWLSSLNLLNVLRSSNHEYKLFKGTVLQASISQPLQDRLTPYRNAYIPQNNLLSFVDCTCFTDKLVLSQLLDAEGTPYYMLMDRADGTLTWGQQLLGLQHGSAML